MTTRFTLKAAASALALAISIGAASAQDRVSFDIESQPLSRALLEFNEQSGLTVAAPSDLVNGRTAPAVEGSLEPSEALTLLLADSGLSVRELPSGALTIVASDVEQSESEERGRCFRSASVAQEAARVGRQPVEEGSRDDIGDEREDDADERDVITVTGTNIRGIAPDSSPSLVFTREDLDISGASTLSEFIRTVPQSFAGGAQANIISLPGDNTGGAANNAASGSSINLRGTGSGATLVLVNGKRTAPGGGRGGFVDISLIPLSAIDRIEIITDGASAIYGADAVGGVVNIVLREDYTGAETFVGVGSDAGGDVIEYRAGASVGHTWNGGDLIASYEFSDRGELDVTDRSFSSASLTPNVLLPKAEVHSGLVSLSQEMGSHVSIRADASYSERSSESFFRSTPTLLTASQTGVRQSSLSLEAVVDVGRDWQLVSTVAYSDYYSLIETDQLEPSPQLGSSQVTSDLLAFSARADGPLFNLPGGAVLAAIGTEYREEYFKLYEPFRGVLSRTDERDVSSIYAEVFVPIVGEGNSLPGMRRLEVTVAGRQDSYSDFGDAFTPKIGVVWSPNDSVLVRSTFGESFNAPNLGTTGSGAGGSFAFNLPNPASPNGRSLAIIDLRGPDLGPEESTSWTVGIDYNRQFRGGRFQSSLTWYDISYVDRIGSPGNFFTYLLNPEVFAPVITFNPDPNRISAIVNDPTAIFVNVSGGTWMTPGDEDVLLDARVTNLASQDTSGIDLDLSYEVNPGIGELSFDLNAAYIFEQSQRLTSTSPALDVIDTIFRPVDFRLRSGATWTLDHWTLAGFVNHVDSYTDNRELNGPGDVEIDAWTTVDLNLAYKSGGGHQNALLNNVRIALSVRNLFDEDPPFIEGAADPNGRRAGYDPANADPLGRFVTLTLTKGW